MDGLEKKLTLMYSETGTGQSEEERELFMRIRGGDENAKEIIVKAMQDKVHRLAEIYNKKMKMPKNYFDEFVHQGNIGVLKAIDSYNPGKGIKFSRYAHHWIRGSIIEHIRSKKEEEIKSLRAYLRR